MQQTNIKRVENWVSLGGKDLRQSLEFDDITK